MSRRRSISGVLALALALIIPAGMIAFAQAPRVVGAGLQQPARGPDAGMRTISVAGSASDSMTPDVARLTVGSETRGRTAREALDANNRAMTALMEALRKKGVASRDVQTGGLTLTTIHERREDRGEKGPRGPEPDDAPARIIGYEIANQVHVTIRDVSKVGEILDAAVASGVNRIGDLSFDVTDARSLVRDLRKKAIADAKAKAEEAARAAGMTLGPPVSITVEDFPSESYSFEARSNIVTPQERSVPISPEEKALSVTVQVTYELRPAE